MSPVIDSDKSITSDVPGISIIVIFGSGEEIDLSLKSLTREDDDVYLLKDIIEKNRIIVILGTPGSGKSSILQKYKYENNKTELISIKKFIKLNKNVSECTKVLLLDGLDEYRSVFDDKTFVLTEIGNRINDLPRLSN